ncbi:MAG: dTDP-4-dehydrorhamnose reductase, partial [Bacteroidales bacterium]|nr:dTDP-4-dehydrorhamnose reductase [Bacteroidales bacterium]
MLTVLVTGCNGQLGMELRRLSNDSRCAFCRFLFVDVDVLDICNRPEVHNYMKMNKVDVVVNAAAYTAVDKAETEPGLAFAVNRDGVAVLADCCVENHAFLIHVSTDYVFDGTADMPYKEHDQVNPIGVYGKSKRAGEEEMMAKGVYGMIIRTAWLYSGYGNNFVKTMLRLGSEREQVMVVADQHGTPTWAADLAGAIIEIIVQTDFSKRQGVEVYHYT